MSEHEKPDGIERRHIHQARGSSFRRWPFNLAGLGILLTVALVGTFGATERLTGEGDGVRLTVEGPKRIRSGEYFEMLFRVETERRVGDAVLRVDADIWHDVTLNTMTPAPTEEAFEDGSFVFHFGPLGPSSRLLFKVDGQINPAYPPEYNRGAVSFADTTATLATVDYSMRVFP